MKFMQSCDCNCLFIMSWHDSGRITPTAGGCTAMTWQTMVYAWWGFWLV